MAQDSICWIIPLNEILVIPILTAAHVKRDSNMVVCPLTHTKFMESECWESSICVNAETKILHTEKDCTYTIISTSKQTKNCGIYEFNLSLNPKTNISINMNSAVSFMFSGLFLSHKQYKWYNGNNDLFYNFSSYGNQRLFNHLKQTLMRYQMNST